VLFRSPPSHITTMDRKQAFVSLWMACMVGLCVSAPVNEMQDALSMATDVSGTHDSDMAWQTAIQREVQAIMHGDAHEATDSQQTNVQVAWTVGKDNSSPDKAAAKPRPPVLDSSISNLRGVLDRLEMENVNAVAVHEAQTSTYAAKKATLQSMLAGPQQAVAERLQQRQLCDKQVKALEQLSGSLSSSVEQVQALTRIRHEQAAHHTQITSAAKDLTLKNKATLDQIRRLVEAEVAAEQAINGGYHFDPVTLRTQQPEDLLRSIKGLASNLGSLMDDKLAHTDAAVQNITAAFHCAACEEKAAALTSIAQRIGNELSDMKHQCVVLAEAHREVDAADREKVISLKKDLEDIEQAEHIHAEANAALQQQRAEAEHVAKKMVGFYQNIPNSE